MLRERVEVVVLNGRGCVAVGQRPDGRIILPGGGTDGQASVAAARREVFEETGVSVDDVHMLPLAPVTATWDAAMKRRAVAKGRGQFDGDRTRFVVAHVQGSPRLVGADGFPHATWIEAWRLVPTLQAQARNASPGYESLESARVRAVDAACEFVAPTASPGSKIALHNGALRWLLG